MKREEIYSALANEKLIAVVRADSVELAKPIIKAIIAGGIKIIEVTMTIPKAHILINELVEEYEGTDIIIGAGTVLTKEDTKLVIDAKAKFVVSPCLVKDVMKVCKEENVFVMPGIMTVKEAYEAINLGADILKIFPANAFEPSIIKAFNGPLPKAKFMPTGGINEKNAADWIKAGAVAVGTGSNLTAGAKNYDYKLITMTAKNYVQAVKGL